MNHTTPTPRRALPLLLAALASLALLSACDKRPADPAAPRTGTTPPTTPPPAETVPGTTPGAMPPASAASG